MLDLHLAQKQLDHLGYAEPHHTMERVERARHLFQRRYMRGRWAALQARVTGRTSRMLDLAAVTAEGKVAARHARGLQMVPILQIQGSESRTQDFDRHFNPIQTHTQERWMNLATVMMADVPLPAVQLVQVGEHYYVQDGHHRISVARAMGYTYIDAEVTVWELAPQASAASVAVSERASFEPAEKNHTLTSGPCFQDAPCFSASAPCLLCHS